ncbi:MAG: hypothetical protein JNN22_07485 [Rhodospirillales bacterium]|nr:hypothetical protein [Rhodospirillales bacterium]
MIVLRIAAWLLFAGAAAAAGHDGFGWLEHGQYSPLPLLAVWETLDSDSLLAAGPAVARHASPAVWEEFVFPVLLAPAWMAATVAGAMLWYAGRPRLPRRRRRPDWR